MKEFNEHHSFVGMQRDIDISKHPSQYLYDARNIRLTSRGDNTLLAITNERGTKETNISIEGLYLGHCLLNQYLIIFSKSVNTKMPDYISRIDLKDRLVSILHNGNLNFSFEHPIEAISSYENKDIQKVYWTDGYNQPRMINIMSDTSKFNDSYFDFIRDLALNEKVSIQKLLGSGRFAPGVIQYALTYYTKYGQESNIFYTSPLLYTSFRDRGASPEDTVENAFRISVSNVDTNFDYLRIYSIQRTSLDGTPIVKRIQDVSLDVFTKKSVYSVHMTPQRGNGKSYSPFYECGVEKEVTIDGLKTKWCIIPNNMSSDDHFMIGGGYITWSRKATNRSCMCITSEMMDTPMGEAYYIVEVKDSVDYIVEPMRYSTSAIFSISFTDTGTTGDSVDPTELLYKGGESLIVKTLEQKDNTLFFGNIILNRPQLNSFRNEIPSKVEITEDIRKFSPLWVSGGMDIPITNYHYSNQLIATSDNGNSVPCGGFKRGDYYRCGIQFQYKDGRWSDPLFIEDKEITNKPDYAYGILYDEVSVPVLNATISKDLSETLSGMGYKKARAVVVFPKMEDRIVICQGILNPTLRNDTDDSLATDFDYKSSWFFRPSVGTSGTRKYVENGFATPYAYHNNSIPYTKVREDYNPNDLSIYLTEIEGVYDKKNSFIISSNFYTFNSPDIEFDDRISILNYTDALHRQVGFANFKTTFSDIDIQTESPVIDSSSSGFLHKSGRRKESYGIISGLFYEDGIVEYEDSEYKKKSGYGSYQWLIYPWQGSGSLNNDVNRPAGKGTRTSVLKKKVISNLRYADTELYDYNNVIPVNQLKTSTYTPQLYNSNEVNILKFGNNIYQGNVDTLLPMSEVGGKYYSYLEGGWNKLYKENIWKWNVRTWADVGDISEETSNQKSSVRMKYKSTPHLVLSLSSNARIYFDNEENISLPIIEICRKKPVNLFGGETDDALKANIWIPCGEPVTLGESYNGDSTEGTTVIQYSYGDTYYQRWDCLKTYPFTPEDINQIVEIGSFMLETRVNIDGRYDRNRGQLNNLNMTPQNFNLLNPVYSQVNNFFTYRILDDDYYNISSFPNQITWSKEKQAGASVDLWTNVTLGSTYDMDGSKGEITSLNTWKDQIFCFQNKGVSNILFNSRVQIPTSDGVPIEITNSYKVDGYRYIADGIGCNDKFQIKETPSGIYFIDSVSNYLFRIADGLQDISTACNMTSWFRGGANTIDRLIYDEVNHDLYLINEKEALCFSEVLGQFTSFMDYGNLSLLESYNNKVYGLYHKVDEEHNFDFTALYEMFAGRYNDFFGRYLQNDEEEILEFSNYRPWYFTFISNGIDNQHTDFDKVFNNLDYRMDMLQDSSYQHQNSLDYIRVFNEYQDTGDVSLIRLKNITKPWSWNNKDANLQKKFRIWRIQIPRDKIRRNDRIRNTWCKVTLGRNTLDSQKAVLHDLNVQYYI